jgi:hypothetical protein
MDFLRDDGVPHQAVGRLSHQDLPWSGSLFQPGRHVHGIPDDQRLAAAGRPGHDFSRVDSGPGGDPHPPGPLELVVQRVEGLPHLDPCPHRSESVILVKSGDPEDCHHRIAYEFLDGSSMPLDHQFHLFEIPRHDSAERFGVEVLAKDGGAGHVRKERGHDLAGLGPGGRLPGAHDTAASVLPLVHGMHPASEFRTSPFGEFCSPDGKKGNPLAAT